jgi:hypothetical protein
VVDKLAIAKGRDRQAPAIYSNKLLTELGNVKLKKFHAVRKFREGHPCWRKITDPLLLSEDGEEMVILDPDLYFPNRFCFEQTPSSGVLLMWQKPSCLLPAETVENAIASRVPLAHHTDIGVAQWRMPVDLEWLNWLIERLGSSSLPTSMHVESIVWAALAMRMGGGHLDPKRWVCWHRTQFNRVLVKLGVGGGSILKREPFSEMKCFHAGGEAKWWLASAYACGILDHGRDLTAPTDFVPYRELAPSEFFLLQRRRNLLRRLGYYSLFSAS